MAETSTIEWTDATWNPITGCTLISEGCRHCYAAELAATRLKHHWSRQGLARVNAVGEAKFTGEVRFNLEWLGQPLRWKRPRMIFVCAHGDLFHESVPDDWIDQVFAVMALAPGHTFQVLTKRPDRARAYLTGLVHEIAGQASRRMTIAINAVLFASNKTWGDCGSTGTAVTTVAGEGAREPGMLRCVDEGGVERLSSWRGREVRRRCSDRYADAVRSQVKGRPEFGWNFNIWPLPNVWLGTSVEDQASADKRVPELLAAPAAVRFLSAEPLLGRMEISRWLAHSSFPRHVDRSGDGAWASGLLDWVIVGGESGRGARPMHPDWARALRDQCSAARVPFFFKQWGEWADCTSVPKTPCDEDYIFAADGRVFGAGGHWKGQMHGSVTPGWREAGGAWMSRIGKKRAGRLLDGREWSQMPDGELAQV